MPLPPAQTVILQFVAVEGQATAQQVTEGLCMDGGDVQDQLTLLTGKDLLDAHRSTVPVSYTATNKGIAALADGA